MQRCINCDWLEVYCLESASHYPCDANFFRDHGYYVEERAYGTRVYNQMFTLLDEHGCPMIEIRRDPASTIDRQGGLFDKASCHIRLSNPYCYLNSPVAFLRDFLAKFDYTFKKIFRLDICLDFETFDRGDDPRKFIQRYMSGKYCKINQTNLAAYGTDRWDSRLWQTLSWGKPKSMVSTKLYNKSLELLQVHDKPYIRQAWYAAGLVEDPITCAKHDANGALYVPTIWRVEFSIKSSANRWYIVENENGAKKRTEAFGHTLQLYECKQGLLIAFSNLADRYFHFKHYEPDKRKDRCADKVLFKFSLEDTGYVIDRLASHVPQKKPLERLIIMLASFQNSTIDPKLYRASSIIIDALQRRVVSNFCTEQAPDLVEAWKMVVDANMCRNAQDNIATTMHCYEADLFGHTF